MIILADGPLAGADSESGRAGIKQVSAIKELLMLVLSSSGFYSESLCNASP